MAEQALEGLKVIEYGNLIAGPYCTKTMAALGAEVIKIEPPEGDEARRMGPFLNDVPHHERSGLFLYMNVNKLGVTLNLRTRAGMKIFHELIKDADIFVENNTPQVANELGIDYPSLKEINPKLIMTSITPYGQTGLYRNYKAHDLNLIHSGGFAYINGDPDNEPVKPGGQQAGYVSALKAAAATMCALYYRGQTGIGQHVDISMQEVVISITEGTIGMWSCGRSIRRREGSQFPGIPFISLYPCKDGYIGAAAATPPQWKGFLEMLGNPDWLSDPNYESIAYRMFQYNDLMAHEPKLKDWLAQRNKLDIYHTAQSKHVPYCPVLDIEELVNHPQLDALGFFLDIEHPETGKLKYPGWPFTLDETPWVVSRSSPLLGQHNVEIYCDRLGYSKQDLRILRETGAI